MDGILPTIIICAVLLIIAVIAVRSYVKKLKSGCCGAGGDEVEKIHPSDKDISHYPYACKIGIEGMSCRNCATRIENAFNEKYDYYAKVSLKNKYAMVHMKKPVLDNELRQIFQRAGYETISLEPVDVKSQ